MRTFSIRRFLIWTQWAWLIGLLSLPVPCPAQSERPGRAEDVGESQTDIPNLWTRKSGTDWPRFLGPSGDSKSPERGIQTDWTKPLPVVWSLPLGESYGICSTSRGRVFQFDRQQDQGVLLCLHAETGRKLWRYQYAYSYRDMYGYNSGPRTSPLVDDDRVYVYGVDGTLACISVLDGTLRWSHDLNAKYGVVQNFFGVGSNPIISGDYLVVMVGGSPAESQSLRGTGRLDRVIGDGTGIVAFDKRTGREVYRLSDELASYASLQLATVDHRDWCFAFLRGGLLAFDPQIGKQDFFFPWRADSLESVNASVPVVVRDRVFISETYGPGSAVLSFRPGEFQVIWDDSQKRRDKSMQTHWNTAIHHEGYFYGSSGRHKNSAELRCVEAETGKVMWSEPGLTRCSLLAVDGHFVCLGEDGLLRLLRATPDRYTLVSEFFLRDQDGRSQLGDPAWAAPILSHGLLYVRGSERLVCLELIPQQAEERP